MNEPRWCPNCRKTTLTYIGDEPAWWEDPATALTDAAEYRLWRCSQPPELCNSGKSDAEGNPLPYEVKRKDDGTATADPRFTRLLR